MTKHEGFGANSGGHAGWKTTLSLSLVMGLAVATAACSHRPKPLTEARLQPDAKQAVDRTRGTCPTDLNDINTVVEKGDPVRLIFLTSDPSNRAELSRRVASVGETLANPHPAVNARGEEIEHPAVPKPVIREATANDTAQYGWELDMAAPDKEQRQLLVADLQDHVRLWRLGECPEMTNAPYRSNEARRPDQTVLREDR